MKKYIFCLILTWSSVAYSNGVVSPFPSSIEGIDLPNAHRVESPNDNVFRGMSPHKHYDDLKTLGITHVLIFKTPSRNEVEKEIEALDNRLGLSGPQVKHIPFNWHDFESFEAECVRTVEALRFIKTNSDREANRVFFHCSAGEDRTGHLAGLFRLLQNPDTDLHKLFEREMCDHGYSGGDPNKPRQVVSEIDRDLTPIFLGMAKLVQSGELTWEKLNSRACQLEPEEPSAAELRRFTCKRRQIQD